jgi:hypothetical protein
MEFMRKAPCKEKGGQGRLGFDGIESIFMDQAHAGGALSRLRRKDKSAPRAKRPSSYS